MFFKITNQLLQQQHQQTRQKDLQPINQHQQFGAFHQQQVESQHQHQHNELMLMYFLTKHHQQYLSNRQDEFNAAQLLLNLSKSSTLPVFDEKADKKTT